MQSQAQQEAGHPRSVPSKDCRSDEEVLECESIFPPNCEGCRLCFGKGCFAFPCLWLPATLTLPLNLIQNYQVEMAVKDAEPLVTAEARAKETMRKPTSLYDVFPKHIAGGFASLSFATVGCLCTLGFNLTFLLLYSTDALNSGKRVEPESHEVSCSTFCDRLLDQTLSP